MRTLFFHKVLECGHNSARLLGMGSRSNPKVVIGSPKSDVIKENIAHLCVVVLSSVDQIDFDAAAF
jgi:hypothetical protein